MLFNLFLMVCSLVIIVSIIKADELENGKDQALAVEGSYIPSHVDFKEVLRETRLVTWEEDDNKKEVDYKELYREGLRKKFKRGRIQWESEFLEDRHSEDDDKFEKGLFSFDFGKDLENKREMERERERKIMNIFGVDDVEGGYLEYWYLMEEMDEEERERFEKGLFSF